MTRKLFQAIKSCYLLQILDWENPGEWKSSSWGARGNGVRPLGTVHSQRSAKLSTRRGWRRLGTWAAAVWLVLAVTTATLPAVEHAALHGALDSITTAELQRHIDVLADDSFEGREAGSRGGHATASYLAKHLDAYGLLPAGESGSYFQGFGANYRNVLGLLEGSDPRLKNEVILVGAHYDHVGYGTASNSNGPIGQIHNGADDNASGVAGILELADAVRQLPEPPRRSILFVFWDGEEKGLLGSQHWARQPTLEGRRVVFALNADMIGRLRDGKVEVYGIRTAPGLREVLSRANHDPEVWMDFTWEMKNNSDHYSFYERGIPSVMLHTGLHNEYHRPSDESHTINAAGLRQVTALFLRLVLDLADRDPLPAFREESRREGPAAQRDLQQTQPLPGPRLGIAWNQESARPGLRVTHVAPNSAAARAGIREGDRLIELNGWPIDDEAEFRYRILAAREPVRVAVQRGAGFAPELSATPSPTREFADAPAGPSADVSGPVEEDRLPGREDRSLTETSLRTETLAVTLDGSPARIGIAWKNDPASPGIYLLSRVIPGSPAHDAGLKPGDWLYEVDGQRFGTSDELARWLQSVSHPMEVLAERRGQLHRLTIPLPHLAPGE
jgi:membrane-associated protease RseP (regulator of RpoE activity)